jgi:hypothetical protein
MKTPREPDPPLSFAGSSPIALGMLLGSTRDDAVLWTTDDLAAMLRHQLGMPLDTDQGRHSLQSFGQALASPNPSLESLEQIKNFARTARSNASLPVEIPTVLYYASLAAARARCERSLTRLSDEDLTKGAKWALALGWVDAGLCAQLERDVEYLMRRPADTPAEEPPV